jgi:hypothetical protein
LELVDAAVMAPVVAIAPLVLIAVLPPMVPEEIAVPMTFPAVERVGISLSLKVVPELTRP